MFLEINHGFIEKQGLKDVDYKDYWKKYEIRLKREGEDDIVVFNLEDLFTADSIERLYRDYEPDKLVFVIGGVRYVVSFEYGFDYDLYEFMTHIAKKLKYSPSFIKDGFILNKVKCDIFNKSIEAQEDVLFRYLVNGEQARGLFPCSDKYSALAVKIDAFTNLREDLVSYNYPRMVCPFIRVFDLEQSDEPISLEYDVDEKVIKTVYDNRLDSSVTKVQIKSVYAEIKNEWAPLLEKVNARAKKASHYRYRPRRYRFLV